MTAVERNDRDEGIQVLRRAAAALDEIAAAPNQLRLVDLTERLGLAKSTARRLLTGLVEVGLAGVDERGRYSLGDRLLGFTSADSTHLAALIRPTIEEVAAATEETVDLSVLQGQHMLFIDQIESPHRLRAVSAVGGKFPLDCTANGKAALAVAGGPVAHSLRDEIAEVRRTGIAFDRNEHTAGISAAGIAGRTVGGHVVAISVPAPTERFCAKQNQIVAALREATKSRGWLR